MRLPRLILGQSPRRLLVESMPIARQPQAKRARTQSEFGALAHHQENHYVPMTYDAPNVSNRRTRSAQGGRGTIRSFPSGRPDSTTQLSWTACCSHLWKREPQARI